MSADAASPLDGGREGGGFVDRYREALFVAGLVLGVVVLALGGAFFLLGATLTTTPPAPYLASTTDKLILLAVSTAAIALGGGIVRGALKLAGW
jgi:hypothetical protein